MGSMHYNIKGTGLEVSAELREYAEKRLTATDKFLRDDPTAHAAVELERQPLRDGKHYRAEFTLSARGATYRAEEWGDTMHEAIDLAMGELLGELRQTKKKKLRLFRHAGSRVKEYLRGWRNKV